MSLEKKLKAVANKRRLAILALLKKKKRVHVGEIAESIKLSFKSTSRHLGKLYEQEILDREQVDKQMFYMINTDQDPFIRHLIHHL